MTGLEGFYWLLGLGCFAVLVSTALHVGPAIRAVERLLGRDGPQDRPSDRPVNARTLGPIIFKNVRRTAISLRTNREHDALSPMAFLGSSPDGAAARTGSFGRSVPNYRAINSLAESILARHGVTQPPVPIKDIVEAEGVDVMFVRFRSMSREIAGFTKFDEATIYVNVDDSLNRQTFTIGHEFGHWSMHRELFEAEPDRYAVLLRRPTGAFNSNPLEKEANAFAAAILMPAPMLRKVKDLIGVRELAQMFAVSPEAMENRLKNVR